MKFIVKKLVLMALLGALPLQAQAGWMPSWLSSASLPSFSTQPIKTFLEEHKGAVLFGAGALLCTGLVGGYFYYKNYKKSNSPTQRPPQDNPGQLGQSPANNNSGNVQPAYIEEEPLQPEEEEDGEKELPVPHATDSGSNNNNQLPVSPAQNPMDHLPSITHTNAGNNHAQEEAEKEKEHETKPQDLTVSTDTSSQDSTTNANRSNKGKEEIPTLNKEPKEKEKEKEKNKEPEFDNVHDEKVEWFYPTFFHWNEVSRHLPQYQLPTKVGHDPNNKNLAVTLEELEKSLDCYFTVLNNDTESFKNSSHWVNQEIPTDLMQSIESEKNKSVFDPFVQKLVIKPGSTVAFHGDIHGDIRSLNAFILDLGDKGYLDKENHFKIAYHKKDFYIVFLGDYTDRGWYGPEVIYTVLRLKSANPDRVFMVRGNHEDAMMNKKEAHGGANGFFAQLKGKYHIHDSNTIFEKINKMYETLPLALYLGTQGSNKTNYLVCCHGGIEVGFNPYNLLNHEAKNAFTKLNTIDREAELTKLIINNSIMQLFTTINAYIEPEGLLENISASLNGTLTSYIPTSIVSPLKSAGKNLLALIGFQWNDYEVDSRHEHRENWFVKNSQGRGWILGKTFSQAVLTLQSDEHNKIRGVFRAHQHTPNPILTPMMRRIFNKDGLDHKHNVGVGKIWIENQKEKPVYGLWDNIVCTFNVSPHTPYQVLGYTYDTYGLLTTVKKFEDWILEVHRIEVFDEQKKEKTKKPKSIKQPAPAPYTAEEPCTTQAIGSHVDFENKKKSKDSKDDLMNDFELLDIEDEIITEEDLDFTLL